MACCLISCTSFGHMGSGSSQAGQTGLTFLVDVALNDHAHRYMITFVVIM